MREQSNSEGKLNIRKLALELIERTEAAGQYSNIALDSAVRRYGLSSSDKSADRAFLTTIVYGVIEKKITLDYCIDSLSTIPPSKIERDTRILLRMGLYQLCFLDHVPDHAAINETVNLCRSRAKGFVNALLRNFARGDKVLPLPSKENGISKYFSVKYSFPCEICDKFISVFGEERTESLLESFNKTSGMTLRVNTLKTDRDSLLKELSKIGISAEKTKFSEFGIKIPSGAAYSSLKSAEEGLFFIQDEASQLCVALLGAVEGDTIIDTCACPGGKSFSIAILMKDKGRVISRDIHENKLSLIESGASRLGITCIETKALDAREFDDALEEMADGVLCDVPCSGFGVFSKKPDIRYKKLSDVEKLPRIQLDILENCSRYVKKGGVLVYSTCTLLPEENEENVRAFLSQNQDFVSEDFQIGTLCSFDGMLTLTPDLHETDGFFMAKFRKKS